MPNRRAGVFLALLVPGCMLMACSLLVPTEGLTGGPSNEEAGLGGPELDGSSVALDGAAADTGQTSATYNDLTDAKRWQAVDLKRFVSTARRFRGGAFDGRYLYLSPLRASTGQNGRVQRFDTTGALDAPSSWSDFDLVPLDPNAHTVGSAGYDGRFVYFGTSRVWARADTLADFASPPAWTFVDPRTFSPSASGPRGLVFDGRYLYAAPFGAAPADGGGDPSGGVVSRLDTTRGFDQASAWSFFPLGMMAQGLGSFHGGVFDGRYVYFVPHFDRRFVRYDTQRSFGEAASWEALDLSPIAGPALFSGAAFDGRHVYLAPAFDGDADDASPSGRVVRFDTQRTFSDTASFQAFDVATMSPAARGYHGATYDGRFVYFVPHSNVIYDATAGQHGQVARFDTQSDFLSGAAWSFFDTTTIDPNAKQFTGAVFDGRYVNFIPARNAVLVRFDARSPAGLPPRWNASFL